MADEEKNDQAPAEEQAGTEEQAAPAEEQAAPAEAQAAAEAAPAEEQPAAEAAPAAAPPAPEPEQAEQLSPRQRRRLSRSRADGPGGGPRSAEDRIRERAEQRSRKAQER